MALPQNSPKGRRDEGRIENLKKGLYSREAEPVDTSAHLSEFNRHSVNVPSEWKRDVHPLTQPVVTTQKNSPWLSKLLIASTIFFAISLGVAAYMMVGGGNVISSKNVEIAISGPVSIDAGEEASLQIEIQNQNNTTLESVNLVVNYPEGSRNIKNLSEEMTRSRESVGDILPGRTTTKKIDAVIFGEEGARKTILVEVEYRVAGSNAVLNKKKPYEVVIASAPVSITVDSLKEANAGQEMEFVVNIVSNSPNPISNALLVAEYPFGFEFTSAVPQPNFNTSIWSLGTLKAQEKRIIKFRGKLEGQDGEERAFRFTIGTAVASRPKDITIPFLTKAHPISIQKPFLGLELSINGESAKTHVTEGGNQVKADILWTNNTSAKVTDAEIQVSLKGTTFDRSSVSTEGGFYRSLDDTIIWNQTNTRGFDVMNPGDSGRISFSFKMLDLSAAGTVLKNPEMTISISAKGKRLESSSVPEEIASSVVRKIQLATKLSILPRIVYYAGPLTNTGSLPPRADQETTYTVMWTLTNPSNDARNTVVSATLPTYVTWKGEFTPGDASIRYNPATGEVVWNAGEVKAGSGYSGPVKEVAFKIGFTPSITQVGARPTLVSSATVSAEDTFTKTVVKTLSPQSLTTDLTTDPSFNPSQGAVVQ